VRGGNPSSFSIYVPLVNDKIKRRVNKVKRRTFAISDIHGELEKLKVMLRKIKFSRNDTLYIVGDVVDRGAFPIEIIEWIMETPNVHMLRGNHESMFLDYALAKDELGKDLALQLWLPNGGYTTYIAYEKRSEQQKEKIRNFVQSLPFYQILGNVILVHSGIDMVRTDEVLTVEEIMKRQDEDSMLWSRKEFFMNKAIEGATIIFGHTPTLSIERAFGLKESYPMKIWHDHKHTDKIGIDCGATFSEHGGRLACICLDDMNEYYV
jgi:serine/threonine protein phosphatase 1